MAKDKILKKLDEPKEDKQTTGYLVDTAIDSYGKKATYFLTSV